jgi:hypothetical protein
MRRIFLLFFIPISIFTCTLPASAGWFGYDSYEDCMLGRMKGQVPGMMSTADRACKKEFHVEVGIYDPSSIEWGFEVDWKTLRATITITHSPEYEVASGEFRFAEKPCRDVTDADFGKPVAVKFYGSVATADTGFLYDGQLHLPGMACAKPVSYSGFYK